ncbi:hypothetical protein V8E54_004232 [Elaphomyces granulatus]
MPVTPDSIYVRAGEVPTSARSIVEKDLFDFWGKNNEREVTGWNPEYRDENDISNWGGPLQRLMMQAIYTISFLCLLRFDEVLKIIDMDQYHIRLTLPFRKTHQNWEIKPFDLWPNTKKRHLDPVHALLRWIDCSNIKSADAKRSFYGGYIFRKITLNDQVSQSDKPLLPGNLLEIGRNPLPYGTHSFRRGGCQYLSSVEGWPIRKLCDWGGWSTSFDNLPIIVRYNWNDDPGNKREDFFKPAELRVGRCKECGQPV